LFHLRSGSSQASGIIYKSNVCLFFFLQFAIQYIHVRLHVVDEGEEKVYLNDERWRGREERKEIGWQLVAFLNTSPMGSTHLSIGLSCPRRRMRTAPRRARRARTCSRNTCATPREREREREKLLFSICAFTRKRDFTSEFYSEFGALWQSVSDSRMYVVRAGMNNPPPQGDFKTFKPATVNERPP